MTGLRAIAPRLWPVALGATLLLGGCSLHGDRNVVAAAPEPPPSAARGPVPAGVRTVKRTVAADEADAAGPDGGMPTPRQIFDFHPPGTTAQTWRQPFIIDPDDGPLAADVRRTAAELHSFLAATKTAPATPVVRRCSETDLATAKSGCIGPAAAHPAVQSGAPAR